MFSTNQAGRVEVLAEIVEHSVHLEHELAVIGVACSLAATERCNTIRGASLAVVAWLGSRNSVHVLGKKVSTTNRECRIEAKLCKSADCASLFRAIVGTSAPLGVAQAMRDATTNSQFENHES